MYSIFPGQDAYPWLLCPYGRIWMLRYTGYLPKMIHHFVTFLHPPSAALFALTSKSIFAVVGSKALKLEKPYRQCCLEVLEPYLPNCLICHVCVCFHPRHRYKSGSRGYRDPLCSFEHGIFRYGVERYSLLFSDVQQIMKRHRFGERHGLSVKDIEFSRSGKLPQFPIRVTETAKARISGDELLLRTDKRFRFPHHDTDLRMAAIYACHRFCRHASQNNMNLHNFSDRDKPFMRCSGCGTETRIRIRRANATHDELQTTSWYRLGSGRDPFDPDDQQWQAITGVFRNSYLIPCSEKQAICRSAFKAALSS